MIATGCCMMVQADKISEKAATQIAHDFFESYFDGLVEVEHVDYQGSYSEDSTEMDLFVSQVAPAFYIFNAPGDRGFVLVSGDDDFPSILGYSVENAWPEIKDMVPEALGWALEAYSDFVESVRRGEIAMPDMGAWYDGSPFPVVGPLQTTKWNQHYPYNKYTPEIYPVNRAPQRFNGHYAAGCGSIATSQIINYWKKPEHPLARKTCYRSKDYVNGTYRVNTYEVTLDSNNYYDYSNMPDSIQSTPETTPWMTEEEWERKGDEIGRFIRDVAYVLNLGWTGWAGGGGSDAYGYEQALVQGFDFSLDAYTIALDGMSQLRNPEIMKQMKQCLDEGMPIICRGCDTKGRGGHVFIFDGYDSNGFVHVNWGWGGNCNNWFDPGFLLTNMYDTKQERNYDFSQDNAITLNLHPRTEVEKVHLDSRQIKPTTMTFSNSDNTIEEKLLNDKFNNPVCYLDKNTSSLSEEFEVLSFLKNLGYDYDFVFELKDDSSVTETDTIRFDGSTLDTRWVTADITCSNRLSLLGKRDGLYTLSGSMRQVLGGETGPWKRAVHDAKIRISGNDAIMNPAVYDKYYHAPQCYHHCDEKNQILVHLDYLNNPKTLFAGDTLTMQLNVTGSATSAIAYLAPETDTTAVLVLTHGERNDTIVNHSNLLNEFILKSRAEAGKTTLVEVKTLSKTFTEVGQYILTYSWPAMGVSIRDVFQVENKTGIETSTKETVNTSPRKFVKDNTIYIKSNGSVYNVQGTKMR